MAIRSNGLRRPVGHTPDPSTNLDGILAPAAAPGQRAAQPLQRPPGVGQYDFLLGGSIDQAVLGRAEAEAERCGVAPHDVLLVSRALSPLEYAEALARRVGVPLADRETIFGLQTEQRTGAVHEWGLPARVAGKPHWVLCAEDHAPDALQEQIAALQARGLQVAIAPGFRIEAALEELWRADRIDRAVMGLHRTQPASSAKGGIWPWQLAATVLAAAAAACSLHLVPDATIAVLTGLIALPFLCVTLLRFAALREIVASAREARSRIPQDAPGLPDRLLPVYTVFVPLLREAGVVDGLVRSLCALDYPAAKSRFCWSWKPRTATPGRPFAPCSSRPTFASSLCPPRHR